MATRYSAAQVRAAQQKIRTAARQLQAEAARAERERQRQIAEYNRRVRQRNADAARRVDAFNREVARVNAHNQAVNQQNRRANAQNRSAIAELNRRLQSVTSTGPRYTSGEQALADRIQEQAALHPEREFDAFLSYARIDGHEVGTALYEALDDLGVATFFDEVAIKPGTSQSLQMDRGLRSARCGITLLTPAYLAGRFWTERELGALLHKPMLIPVLHNVAFDQVAEYSGILPDMAGFETSRDSVEVIAEKIAAALLPTAAPAA